MVRRVITGLVVSGLCVLGPGAAGMGTVAQAAGKAAPHRLPWPHVVRLRAAYLRELGHVRSSRIAGITRPVGYRPAAPAHRAGRAPAAPCTEPNCRLTYHGGAVQQHPRVYLLLWGPKWQTDQAEQNSAAYLRSFYSGLGVEPQDTWSAITSQYPDRAGFPAFGRSVYVGAFNDTSTPPAGTTQAQFAAEAAAFAKKHGLKTGLTEDQIVVATQSGTCPNGFAAGCPGGSNYCAWHSSIVGGAHDGLTYTNLPYLLDAGASCGEDIVTNGGVSQYDGFSIVGGHEYAETATDPDPGTGWLDFNDVDISGGEIGDKCAWVYPGTGISDIGLVALSTGTFAVQPLFSNDTFGNPEQSCALAANPDTLTLSVPASESGPVDAAVSLKVKAVSSTGAGLSFTATGLPAGLTISPAGVITGAPSATGTSTVTVAAQDATGAYRSASFGWTAGSVTGHLTGYKKLCAAARKSGKANGTKVVISSCGGAAGEKWTLGPGGSLSAVGKCVTDPHSGGAGTGLVIESCTQASNQRWTRNLKGEYVLGRGSLCLTDPGPSAKAGTQLTLAACRAAAGQVWSLP